MMIRFVNGSTWQVAGSDNYNSLVGSSPAGVVFSEWALANPSARAYLRPIFAENNGWQVYITTPRGKNHAYKTFNAAQRTPGSFAQRLSAYDTGSMSLERLEEEKRAYIMEWGQDQGLALFQQEYECSFDAALLGAYYGRELRALEDAGRLCEVEYDPSLPVYTAWDLGYHDDTAIWFYQVVYGEIRIIDYYEANGQTIESYAEHLLSKPYRYERHYLPHDARAKTLSSGGKSIIEQLAKYLGGIQKLAIVPSLSVQDGIQAVRQILPRCYFDDEKTSDGFELLKQYQREWDEEKKMFRETPKHDFTSHTSDAFRMLAIAYREIKQEIPKKLPEFPIRGDNGIIRTAPLETLWAENRTRKERY